MKKQLAVMMGALAMFSGIQTAQAHVETFNITTTWLEPDTQPRDSIFIGAFNYDEHTKSITGLKGKLSESMTGDQIAYNPATGINGTDNMTWLDLNYQLASWYDSALGGSFAAVFKNQTTTTFWGGGWTPEDGVAAGGVYAGFPKSANNPGNAYALIFVPDDPLMALTQAQINKLAYADCAPGGMMGAVCMTGTSEAGYGAVGTMSGYPVSQVITLASVVAVPEADSYAMLIAGLGVMAGVARRRRMS